MSNGRGPDWAYGEAARLSALNRRCRCGTRLRAAYLTDFRHGRTIILRCVCGRSTIVWKRPPRDHWECIALDLV